MKTSALQLLQIIQSFVFVWKTCFDCTMNSCIWSCHGISLFSPLGDTVCKLNNQYISLLLTISSKLPPLFGSFTFSLAWNLYDEMSCFTSLKCTDNGQSLSLLRILKPTFLSMKSKVVAFYHIATLSTLSIHFEGFNKDCVLFPTCFTLVCTRLSLT